MDMMEGVEEHPDRWGQSRVWLHSCWSFTKIQRQTSTPFLLQPLNPSAHCDTHETDTHTHTGLRFCTLHCSLVGGIKFGHKTSLDLKLKSHFLMCKGDKHSELHKWITKSTYVHNASSKKHFYWRIEWNWQSRCNLCGPAWHDMKQRFYVVCQIYWRKKNQCILTALHKELLCLDISFLPVYFCLGRRESLWRPRGSRAGTNNVGIHGGNCKCCLFTAVSAVTQQEEASLQTISYDYNIHQRRRVKKVTSAQVQHLLNTSKRKFKINRWWC